MLNTPTEEQLHAMRLGTMASTWQEQGSSKKLVELEFDERFAMIVDAEYLYRENRKLDRLLRDAKLRIADANLEDIRSATQRGIDKGTIRQLQSERWLNEHQNVLITGPTGVGKTYLACALGQLACRRGHRTLYRRLPRLLDELSLARADGTYTRLLDRLAKARLLIIDDWGLAPLKDIHTRDVLEILEDRYGRCSTIFTSQLPTSKWHGYVGEPTIADAILDRLVHGAYKCELKGSSRRKKDSNTK